MASIRSEEIVQIPADRAWAALRDVGNTHMLFAGVLVDGRIDGDIRTVTFANGMIVRERVVDIDEEQKRVAYTVLDGLFEHHSASMTIVPDGPERCRFVWISDFLPGVRQKSSNAARPTRCGATCSPMPNTPRMTFTPNDAMMRNSLELVQG